MLVKDYLNELSGGQEVTFVVVKAMENDRTTYYSQTPIRTTHEWLEGNTLDYIVCKKDTSPIDITGNWDNWYKMGRIKCCMIISEDTLKLQYSEKQANEMIEMYKNKY